MPQLAIAVAVIGGGPAGYTAALRAARLGASATLIERGDVGGACLNRACIPTKTLLHSLAVMADFKDAARFGIQSGPVKLDLQKLRERKNAVVDLMSAGVRQLLENSGVKLLKASARLLSPQRVEITAADGAIQILKAQKIIIATGSIPRRLDVPGAGDTNVVYPSDILELARIPRSAVIIGGGAVGVEMASILGGLGCKVDILELMPRILPGEDEETTRILERSLKKDGIGIRVGVRVTGVESSKGMKRVRFVYSNAEDLIEAEQVCVAVGQKPLLDGLGLENCRVAFDSRGVAVDEHMRTSVPNIFAAGDVTGKSMLAYVAAAQGRVAAENALGTESVMDYSAVPRCIYTAPELAGVGLTEIEAQAKVLKVKVLRSDMAANPAATIQGERRGMVKLVVDAENETILGVHIVGKEASSLIGECTLAVRMKATAGDLRKTLHVHPALSEAVWDAVLSSD